MPVGNPSQPVFVPAVGLRARMIVRHGLPNCAVDTVVFSHGPPGPLAYIRTPALPVLLTTGILLEPLVLCQDRRRLVMWRVDRPHTCSLSDFRRGRQRLLRCATLRLNSRCWTCQGTVSLRLSTRRTQARCERLLGGRRD